ncbi:unnamed protein product [marine sediment metagenome]|uniref:Uncharacterized protein n=1 Tax=marine sediment metagenome TaxID=412755 RepID=X1U4N2_9ZZZZ
MIDIAIPGTGELKIKQLVLDLNGTIAMDGEIIDGVAEKLDQLSRLLDIFYSVQAGIHFPSKHQFLQEPLSVHSGFSQ